jgi:ATP-binding protein involved in chromosome partitioning
MGPVTFRTYHEVEGADRSGLGEQVGAQRARVANRLRTVKRTVAVMSGKGGVGKSYIASALALGMAQRMGGGVGLLDADLNSPTASRLLGAKGPLRVDEDGVHPAAVHQNMKVMSMDLLLEEGQPLTWRQPSGERFVWRGLLETGALRELLGDVAWGSLDALVIDLPPGADRLSDLFELVPRLTGALVVTIPSEESRASVERSIRSAQQLGVPLLGVVENMSGYACDGCGGTRPLFEGRAGSALADAFGIRLLGSVPFRPADDRQPQLQLPATILDSMISSILSRPAQTPSA